MDSRIFSKIKKGDIMPYFNLKDLNNRDVSSDDFLKRKNLIIFFFNRLKDTCCREYLLMLNRIYDELSQAGAEILVISQEERELLDAFSKKHNIKYRMLLDSSRTVINKFTYKDKEGNNICALFIADKYQSLYQPFFHEPFGVLPEAGELLSSAEFLEEQCPECGVSTWPLDS